MFKYTTICQSKWTNFCGVLPHDLKFEFNKMYIVTEKLQYGYPTK